MEIAIDVNAVAKTGYTGNNGIYVHAKPDTQSADNIAELASRFGLNVDVSELHVTLMYSKEAVLPAQVPLFNEKIKAAAAEVKHWVGHNDKRYLVLALQCERAVFIHSTFVRCGAKPTFVPYAPHVTLSNDIAISEEFETLIKKVNASLSANPLELFFQTCNPEDLRS